MSQPTPYVRQTDFPSLPETFSSFANGAENEFDAIQVTIRETLSNLALIQKDDGGLTNGIVTLTSLSSDVATFLGGSTSAWSLEGPWLTTTAYVVGDVVMESTNTYVCAVAHTSGTFATDLAAGKWILLALGTTSVPDGAVTTAKLAALAVTDAKIDSGAVTTDKIGSLAVTTAKIDTGAVTQAKIADNAVDIAQMTHHTVGEMMCYGLAGAPAIVSAGTTRQVLLATTSAAPAFAKHGGDWGRNLGASTVSSPIGSAAYAVNTGFPLYVMYWTGLHVDTDGVDILVTFSDDNASTYEASGYQYHCGTIEASSTSYAAAASSSDTEIELVNTMGNAATETCEIIMFIHNFTSGKHTQISGHTLFRNTSGVIRGGPFMGSLADTNAITHVKIAPSSGNIDGGTTYLWGCGEG